MAFSSDGRLLVAQGGAPDWTLCLWVWEKSKLVASARSVTQPGHAATQCAFQPGGCWRERSARWGCGIAEAQRREGLPSRCLGPTAPPTAKLPLPSSHLAARLPNRPALRPCRRRPAVHQRGGRGHLLPVPD